MSKKEKTYEHIVYQDEGVRSVLLGVTIKTLCGKDRTLTREEFESLEYGPVCAECMAESGKQAVARRDVIRLSPKLGWQDLVERSWKSLYGQLKTRPVVYTYNAFTSGMGYSNVTNTGTYGPSAGGK